MRPIFQSKYIPARYAKISLCIPSIEDARHAVRTMKTLQQKKDYFDSLGLDYDRVETYYNTVQSLNNLIKRPMPIYEVHHLQRNVPTDFIKAVFHGCILIMGFFIACILEKE